MQQAIRRRGDQRAGGNILGLILMTVLVFGGFVYTYRVLTTGDWLWWSSSFNATPRQLAIIDRGERTELHPSDPLFHELAGAMNEAISRGYHYGGFGVSDITWQRMEADGVMIEATYAEPVKLRGGVQPTRRLLLLIGGRNLWTEQILFRSNDGDWDRIPLRVSTVEPVRDVLARAGVDVAPRSDS
jgi:hypothetical protein